jgi:hypothetical protein
MRDGGHREHAGGSGGESQGGSKDPGETADMSGMPDRRSEARMLCADILEVDWTDAAGKSLHSLALLEDISSSGACLQLETALPVAAEVRWQSRKQSFKGNVRYCVYREIGYFVGVQFDQSCKWSKKTYRPQHLLDLKRLLGARRKPRSGSAVP